MAEIDKMVDFVIYALDEGMDKDGKATGSAGKEIKGSMVKIMRFPEKLDLRKYDRFSGPWQDIRMSLNDVYRWREAPGIKNIRAPRKILEPVVSDGSRLMSVNPENFPIKVDEVEGTLVRSEGKPYPRFSNDNAKYLESVMRVHDRFGTMAELDDETSDAVYTDQIPKLKNLVGKKVWWEFRAYIRTSAGAAAGVDDYRLAIVAKDEEAMGDEVAERKS